MPTPQVKIISSPKENNPAKDKEQAKSTDQPEHEAGFLDKLAEEGAYQSHLQNRLKSCIREAAYLKGQLRWDEIISLFYPLEDKEPELVQAGLANDLRLQVSFALGQKKYFDEAIKEGEKVLDQALEDYQGHSSLAYHLYNSLFAARNREIILRPETRKERIQKAHKHLRAAQELRPDQVTSFYREGLLFKTIENKPEQAMPLFARAVENWDSYTEEQKQYRHQEKKNFIKALYNLASCQGKKGDFKQAMVNIKRCLAEDEQTCYLKMEHKQFALAKTHFQLGQLDKAISCLEEIICSVSPKDSDYVFELLARIFLVQGQAERGLEVLNQIPVKYRKPYVHWTEAGLLEASGRTEQAQKVLLGSIERDKRSKHKSLVQLCKIKFRERQYDQGLEYARQAVEFHQTVYSTPDSDGLFWQAACLLMLGREDEAMGVADELAAFRPEYPYLQRLKERINKSVQNKSI